MAPSRPSPEEAARGIFKDKYEGARVLFLGGSVLRGEATPTSDLDIVVVYESLPNACRESFVYAGWPVEAFVHDAGTLAEFFERDRLRGVPALMSMVWEGAEVPGPSRFSGELKRRARELLEAGPPPWDEKELALRRYRLTDWIEDVRHPRSGEELVATGAWLYQDAAEFYFRARGRWSAHSKTIPRRLRAADVEFAEKFIGAFEALFAGKRPGAAVALVEEMLEPFGGLLFDGFRQEAVRVMSDE